MSNICVSSQEEKFIFVVDKYITHIATVLITIIFTENFMCFSLDTI
jgi:hypothetical protein